MKHGSHSQIALAYFRQYWLAVLSAAFLFRGIVLAIDLTRLAITTLVVRTTNYLLLRAFRDVMLLPSSGDVLFTWFSAYQMAVGTVSIVLGIFLGLWVNSRKPPQQSA